MFHVSKDFTNQESYENDFCESALSILFEKRNQCFDIISIYEKNILEDKNLAKNHVKSIERLVQIRKNDIASEDLQLSRDKEDKKNQLQKMIEEVQNLQDLITRTKCQTDLTRQNADNSERLIEHNIKSKEIIRDVYQGVLKIQLDQETQSGIFLPSIGMPIEFSFDNIQSTNTLWDMITQSYVPDHFK